MLADHRLSIFDASAQFLTRCVAIASSGRDDGNIGTTFEPGAPVVLFPTHIFGGGADDGHRLRRRPPPTALPHQYGARQRRHAVTPITLLQSWQPVAKSFTPYGAVDGMN
jgi:hypothetical protein